MTIQPSYVSLTQNLYHSLKAADTLTNKPTTVNIQSSKPDGFISYEAPALNTTTGAMIKNPEYLAAMSAVKKVFSITSDILAVSFLQFLDTTDDPDKIGDGSIAIAFIDQIADDPNNARINMEEGIRYFSTMQKSLSAQSGLNPEMKKCLAELPRFIATLRNMYRVFE